MREWLLGRSGRLSTVSTTPRSRSTEQREDWRKVREGGGGGGGEEKHYNFMEMKHKGRSCASRTNNKLKWRLAYEDYQECSWLECQ